MIKKPLLMVAGIFINYLAIAQKNPYQEVSIASPTAASLGKYADVPVNNHTGIPQISIPIYSVKEGSLELPISLNYHASGIKVEEPASWVGAGWSLNAGGVITRTVRGAPDEKNTSSVDNQTHGYFSDYGYNSYMWVPGSNPASGIDSIMTWSTFSEGTKDGEPDLFFFNFSGYSGKFFFNDDRTPVLLPEQDIKIEANYPGTGSIKSFTITTPDGTKYLFGRTDDINDVDPIEKTKTYSSISGLSYGDVISSWYLNKIISPDGVFSITLSYVSEGYGYFTNAKFSSVSYNVNEPNNLQVNYPQQQNIVQSTVITIGSENYTAYQVVGTYLTGVPHPSNGFGTGYIREYALTKNMIEGVRLSKISFSNGSVDFIAGDLRTDLCAVSPYSLNDGSNTEAKTLGSIKVLNTDSTLCYKFDFNYSYFEDTISALQGLNSGYSINSDKKRLKLDSIQQKTCSGSISNPPYSFVYFSGTVPRRLSFALDHWGFNNGASNTALMPGYTVNKFINVSGANREPKWPEMRVGTLQKMIYPTGGFSEFDYEPHKTWVSSPQYSEQSAFSMQMGYDGGYIPIEQYFTLTSSPYKIKLINAPCPSGWTGSCTAVLSIYDSVTNQLVETVSADRTLTTTKIIQLPAGRYRMMLFKDKGSATGNVGCTANAYEMSTTTYSRNDTVGGLRIKSITNNNGTGLSNTLTNYVYEVNGQSSGILYGRPTYVQVVRNDILKNIGIYNTVSCSPNGCISCDNGFAVTYVQNPGSIRPMDNTQGAHIGYNEVKISQTGNGYSIYRYYGSQYWDNIFDDIAYRNVNIKTPCEANSPNYPSAPFPTEFMRGELKYEGHYNESGQVLKEADYVPVYTDNPTTTPCFIAENYPGSSGSVGQIGTFYELKTAKKTRTSITERILMPGAGYMVNTKTIFYESPYHTLPTRDSSVNSTGQAVETKTKYVLDFRIPACDSISNGIQQYISTANSLLGTFYSQSGSQCGSANCTWIAYQYYMHNLSIARRNYVYHRRINFTDSSNNFKTNHNNAKSAANADLKPVLELQDQFQNLPIEGTSWKYNYLTGAGFNKYDFETGSTSKVYLNKFLAIQLGAPSSTFTQTSNTSSSLSKDSRYFEKGSYKFLNGNPSEARKKDDIPNTYIWDYNNQHPIAQVSNGEIANIAYTSFEADGKGYWSFSGSPATDQTCPTGKKAYVLNGSNNITKSGLNSNITYIVSYWTKNSSAFSITGTTSGYPISGRTVGGWKYFEHHITGQTTITISGNNSIDELRLYPKDALMTTNTYNPLIGLSSQCDVNNRITYYEYDVSGRLYLVRDQDRNIIKKICYNYTGQQEDCSNPITNVPVTYYNYYGLSGFTASYTNSSTSQTYNFSVGTSEEGSLGSLPPGTYTLTISKPGNPWEMIFGYGCTNSSGQSGTSVTFYNVIVSATNCNFISIDLP